MVEIVVPVRFEVVTDDPIEAEEYVAKWFRIQAAKGPLEINDITILVRRAAESMAATDRDI